MVWWCWCCCQALPLLPLHTLNLTQSVGVSVKGELTVDVIGELVVIWLLLLVLILLQML